MSDAAAPSAAPAPSGLAARFKAFKEKHHIAFEVTFFFAGFLFDVVLLHRIDSTPLLIHQGLYLGLSALLIFWDHRLHVAGKEPEGLLGKIAGFRLWVMHFFLGTLLNAFMVFYFRASSGLLAFLFLVALSGLIVANELPRFRAQGPLVRVMMLSFAVTSYLAYLLPVLWGQLHAWQYVVSVGLGSAATYGLWRLFTRFTHDPNWTFKRAVAPGLIMQGTLLVLYLIGVIPPVPLSLKHIGVYTDVSSTKDEKGHKHYQLTYQPAPGWEFWRKQNTTFVAPTGTHAYVFVRIFAPTKFQDQVRFAWDYDDPDKGWTQRGNPYTTGLSGGNEEGFRTFAYSTMGKPGTYRVRVLTTDDREIGRASFEYVEGELPPTEVETD
ncbi:MAG: DUF2914 domain-containing protein [Myxococcaceae bacterium]